MKTKLLITSLSLIATTVYAQSPTPTVGNTSSINKSSSPQKAKYQAQQVKSQAQQKAQQKAQSYGPITVTPQLMNTLEAAAQKQQSAEQKYISKRNEVKMGLEDKGYEVTTVVAPSLETRKESQYYVTGPNGGVVIVNSTDLTDASNNVDTVEKTIYVSQPGQEAKSVQIVIHNPDAKAAKILESDITLSPEALEVAKEIGYRNGSITVESAQSFNP